MYSFFVLLISIFFSGIVASLGLCISVQRSAALFAAVFCTFVWYRLFCPVYNGPVFTQLSDNRYPIQGAIVRPWGDTFECKPNDILYPKTLQEVQATVKSSARLRVVGAGHSFSPLICTTNTLLSLENLKKYSIHDDYISVQSGFTIEMLQTLLLPYNNIVHGFGSIQDQNVVGAFMTSHHGLSFYSFAEEVKQITVVLSNGTVQNVTGDGLKLWRSSMGMLGVVVSMQIRTHPNKQVVVTTMKLPIEEAINKLPTGFAGIIETNYNQKKHALLKHIVLDATITTSTQEYPVATNHFMSAIWDTLLIPITVLFPFASSFPLLTLTTETTTRVPMLNAWTHHSEYGMMYSAYAVPFKNCTPFIDAINTDKDSHFISTILVRYLKGQENTTCLTFAAKDACVVDIYDLQSQKNMETYHIKLEKLVHSFGGLSHWGKYYVGDIQQQVQRIPCFHIFNKTRAKLDPNDKFLNNYTKEIVYNLTSSRFPGNTRQHYRTNVMAYSVVIAFCVLFVVTMLIDVK